MYGQGAAPLPREEAFRPQEGMPMSRFGRASAHFYGLCDEGFEVVKKAPVFSHGIA